MTLKTLVIFELCCAKMLKYKSLKFLEVLDLTTKTGILFIIVDWKAKVGSKEIPGVTGKFGRGVQNDSVAVELSVT